MEPMMITGTPKTPTVIFDAAQGLLEIKGRSSPENSPEFYKPLSNWVQEYAQSPKERTVVNVHLEYFNTSSSKCLLDLFKKLEAIYKSNHDVLINWYYDEDESMLEAGEDYRVMTHLPFKMIDRPDY
jgi:hypothetical protein